jgi:hypothetical protein
MVLQNSCVLTAVPTAHTCTTLLLYLRTSCYRVRGINHQYSSLLLSPPNNLIFQQSTTTPKQNPTHDNATHNIVTHKSIVQIHP